MMHFYFQFQSQKLNKGVPREGCKQHFPKIPQQEAFRDLSISSALLENWMEPGGRVGEGANNEFCG
jgi:hypothetical protein